MFAHKITSAECSLIHIHVSLWDVKARSFQRDFKEHRWKNVLTVMTGLLVKNSKGESSANHPQDK